MSAEASTPRGLPARGLRIGACILDASLKNPRPTKKKKAGKTPPLDGKETSTGFRGQSRRERPPNPGNCAEFRLNTEII